MDELTISPTTYHNTEDWLTEDDVLELYRAHDRDEARMPPADTEVDGEPAWRPETVRRALNAKSSTRVAVSTDTCTYR